MVVKTNKAEYETKTVIVASGRVSRKLGVEGEDEFRNKGVTYCATCDAPLFSNVDVAVVGGGNSGLDATLQLVKIANKIYLIEAAPELQADPVMIEKARKSDKVIIYTHTQVQRISGENFVKGIEVSTEGKSRNLPVGGVFVEIGFAPASGFVESVEKNSAEEIMVNCKCETNISGIYAAGDVTNVPAKQIIVACGEGAKAALSAFNYLNRSR